MNISNEAPPKKDNFLHKTINVTDWMKESIEKYVISKEYTILLFNINSEIMTRMGKITIINTFSLKMKDKNDNLIVLDDYNSINKEYDDLSLKWLIDFVKEKEMEAILKFGGKALGTETNEVEKIGKQESFKVEGEKKYGSFKMDMYFSSTVHDMIDFISNPRFYNIWMGPDMKEVNNTVTFENIIFSNIKKMENSISLEYKWKDWDTFSFVSIEFVQMNSVVKLHLTHKNIPVELIDNVKNHWKHRIFTVISNFFGASIKE